MRFYLWPNGLFIRLSVVWVFLKEFIVNTCDSICCRANNYLTLLFLDNCSSSSPGFVFFSGVFSFAGQPGSPGRPGAPGFDGQPGAPAPEADTFSRSGGPGAPGSPGSDTVTQTVRTFFPETWLWDLINIE